MNEEQIIEMIRDDNTPKELIIAQFETAFKYQMDLQKNIDILHNNQNKLIDEIGEQDKEIERLNNIINETIKDIEHSTLLLEEERVKLKDTPFGKRILYKLKELKEYKIKEKQQYRGEITYDEIKGCLNNQDLFDYGDN